MTGGSTRTSRRSAAASTDREQYQAIREWAQTQGLNVSSRGRFSSEVLEAYTARDEVSTSVAAANAEESKWPHRTSTVQRPIFSGVPA